MKYDRKTITNAGTRPVGAPARPSPPAPPPPPAGRRACAAGPDYADAGDALPQVVQNRVGHVQVPPPYPDLKIGLVAAVVVRSPRRHQPLLVCQGRQSRPILHAVAAIDRLQPCQPVPRQLRHHRRRLARAQVEAQGVGQYRYPPRRHRQAQRHVRCQPLLVHVRRPAFGQPHVERLLDAPDHALAYEDAGDVRPAGAHTSRLLLDLVIGDRQPEAGHQLGHMPVTRVPDRLQPGQLVLQRPFARGQEVHQEMHGPPMLAGDLDARHQLDTELSGPSTGRGQPVDAVVVGQRHRSAPGGMGQLRDPLRGVGPVGNGRMGMQIDHRLITSCTVGAKNDRNARPAWKNGQT